MSLDSEFDYASSTGREKAIKPAENTAPQLFGTKVTLAEKAQTFDPLSSDLDVGC